jgi:hypothetical protein
MDLSNVVIFDKKKLSNELKKKFVIELKDFKFINHIDDLRLGVLVRYVNILNNGRVKFGGILMRKEGRLLYMRNTKMQTTIIKFDRNIIFMKYLNEKRGGMEGLLEMLS